MLPGGGGLVRSMGSTSNVARKTTATSLVKGKWSARFVVFQELRQVLQRVVEEEHGGRKRLFTYEGLILRLGRSRTKNPKGRMFKVLLLVKGKIHCHYH